MKEAATLPTSSAQTARAGSDPYRLAACSMIAGTLAATVIFSVWPVIDLWASHLFYSAQRGFLLANNPAAEAIRQAIWRGSELVALGSLAGLILAAFHRRIAGIPARVWGFVVLLYALGPGLIVDGLLKSYSGRARPAEILQFGGDKLFSPALIVSDQCQDNCSFVSGEGSGAAALSISLIVILTVLRDRIGTAAYRTLVAISALLGLVGATLRMMTGRHYLSDTVFAVLIVGFIALGLHWALLRRQSDRP